MAQIARIIRALSLSAIVILAFASPLACGNVTAPLRLTSSQPAAGRTFYVATTGNDANPGSVAQPWRTIQHGADVLEPGEAVLVRGGTYAESVTVARSGSQNNPITFSAYSGETVILDGGGSEWAGFIVDQGVSNVVLAGFTVRNYSEVSVDVRGTNSYLTLANLDLSGANGGVRITWGNSGDAPMYGPADHITIRDSHIHDNHLSGIDATPGPTTDLVFQRLTVENNGVGVQSFGADGIAVERGYPILVEDVTIRNNGGDGLDLNSRDWSGNASEVVVRRNQVIGNHLQAIKLWAGGRMENNIVWGQGINPVIVGVFTSTVEVVNNTVAFNMYDPAFSARDYAFVAASPEIGFSPPVDLTLLNNVFAFNTGPEVGTPTGLYLGAGVSLTERNNLYFSRDDGEIEAEFITGRDPFFTRAEISDGTWTAATGQGQGDVAFDPHFTGGWPAVNLHLKSGSPAVDAGASTGAPSVDLEGTPRPQGGGYDIGAYEWTGAASPSVQAYLPAILDDAYGGWNTGISIQNTSASAVQVDITFYDESGTNISSAYQTIPGHGYWGLYQGGALGGPAASAKIVSNGLVALVVNEIGPAGRAISYNGTS